jgi:putative oxidoreductase
MKLNDWMPQALGGLTSLLFIEHGTQKLLELPAPAHGVAPLLSLMGFGGCLKVVGGILLLMGLKTRIVAFILSGEMAVAYFMAHAPRAFFPVLNGGDAAILFCFMFLFFVFSGAGAWSVDSILGWDSARREVVP